MGETSASTDLETMLKEMVVGTQSVSFAAVLCGLQEENGGKSLVILHKYLLSAYGSSICICL